ncbi:Thioredoxin-like fold containing protein [Parasponia andersonii]|uniref:protein-disulfide reductase n=1 Tax=Parasponia andersonii TaxID=3476 RepID=A0A2P5ASR5_PARAD|nr:Thioredoxin-like fold containing protein [Parasponia andersonii]
MADSGDVLGVTHDLSALLSSEERDYLVRNNGDQVKISSLNGKVVGLYFSLSWCTGRQSFTLDELLEFYQEVASKGDFEVVFLTTCHQDYDSFKRYFSKMPWLAVPFHDSDTRRRLMEFFDVRVAPTIVIFDSHGNVATVDGIKILLEYGTDAYPFTREIINSLLDKEEEAKKNNFIRFILTFKSRNYLISKDRNQVPISELEGKTVALYFWPLDEFTSPLIDIYNKLKAKGDKFEIVSISWTFKQDEEKFNKEMEKIPWLALPFKDKTPKKLIYYFDTNKYPTLVIIGPDGKILNSNAIKLLDEYGVEAYPFTPKRLDELAEIDKIRQESQTLESLLVYGDRDFVIDNSGSKVMRTPSMSSFPACPGWLYLFNSHKEPRELINVYGANAYPFTKEHLQHLEEHMDEMAKGWPKKLRHELHAEHEFSLTRHVSVYRCDGCLEMGIGWYFQCEQCCFGLHPNCALKKNEEANSDTKRTLRD